jgi:hypothetical protein
MPGDRWTRWGKVLGTALLWSLGWAARLLLFWVVVTTVGAAVLLGIVWTAIHADRWWAPYALVATAGVGAVVLPRLGSWFSKDPPLGRAPDIWLLASVGGATLALLELGRRAALPHLALAMLPPLVWTAIALRRGYPERPLPVGVPTGDDYLSVMLGAYARPTPALGDLEVLVREDAIHVARYPYVHASVYPGDVTLPPSRITATFGEITAQFAWSPAVVLDGREVIFLPRDKRDALRAFADRHGIPSAVRADVWAHLAEPYIDQPYEPGREAYDYKVLATYGFPRDEVDELRREIAGTMYAYMFFSFEWIGYETHDVVRAYAALRPAEFTRERYEHIMRVALRPYGAGAAGADG